MAQPIREIDVLIGTTKWAQANATDLLVYGLWGVPSFRVGDFVAWGQDRLPLLADRLARHAINRP